MTAQLQAQLECLKNLRTCGLELHQEQKQLLQLCAWLHHLQMVSAKTALQQAQHVPSLACSAIPQLPCIVQLCLQALHVLMYCQALSGWHTYFLQPVKLQAEVQSNFSVFKACLHCCSCAHS